MEFSVLLFVDNSQRLLVYAAPSSPWTAATAASSGICTVATAAVSTPVDD
jgi:hypothetical protein